MSSLKDALFTCILIISTNLQHCNSGRGGFCCSQLLPSEHALTRILIRVLSWWLVPAAPVTDVHDADSLCCDCRRTMDPRRSLRSHHDSRPSTTKNRLAGRVVYFNTLKVQLSKPSFFRFG